MTETSVEATRQLRMELEDLYYLEADLLDERKFDEWLLLFTDDLKYRMPIALNLSAEDIEREYLTGALDVHWMDEGKATLATRVAQIKTGRHWAEEPLSRTTHAITNVRILRASPSAGQASDVTASCRFIVYRNRHSDHEHLLVGRRIDRLRRTGGNWTICERTVLIPHSVLLAGSLSFFV